MPTPTEPSRSSPASRRRTIPRQPTLKQELISLRKLKREYSEAKRVSDTAKERFEAAQARLLERMEAEEVDSLRADGTTFSPVEKVYASVQDRTDFVAWARDNEPELIEDRERKELLNALVRERLDNGEPLPPGVGHYPRTYISMRNAS